MSSETAEKGGSREGDRAGGSRERDRAGDNREETGQEAAEKERGKDQSGKSQPDQRSVDSSLGNQELSVPSSECCAADQSAQWWPWALD